MVMVATAPWDILADERKRLREKWLEINRNTEMDGRERNRSWRREKRVERNRTLMRW